MNKETEKVSGEYVTKKRHCRFSGSLSLFVICAFHLVIFLI